MNIVDVFVILICLYSNFYHFTLWNHLLNLVYCRIIITLVHFIFQCLVLDLWAILILNAMFLILYQCLPIIIISLWVWVLINRFLMKWNLSRRIWYISLISIL